MTYVRGCRESEMKAMDNTGTTNPQSTTVFRENKKLEEQ
jgi:hypothetical protein